MAVGAYEVVRGTQAFHFWVNSTHHAMSPRHCLLSRMMLLPSGLEPVAWRRSSNLRRKDRPGRRRGWAVQSVTPTASADRTSLHRIPGGPVLWQAQLSCHRIHLDAQKDEASRVTKSWDHPVPWVCPAENRLSPVLSLPAGIRLTVGVLWQWSHPSNGGWSGSRPAGGTNSVRLPPH